MDALQQMYQQVILDHAKRPHGRVAEIAGCSPNSNDVAVSHQVNPTCGDEITLALQVKDGKVDDIVWQGQGCSVSQASASVMTDIVQNSELKDAQEAERLFHQLMSSRGKGLDDDAAEDILGDAVAFTGTSQYPARIKCALLGWMALKDALTQIETGESREQ